MFRFHFPFAAIQYVWDGSWSVHGWRGAQCLHCVSSAMGLPGRSLLAAQHFGKDIEFAEIWNCVWHFDLYVCIIAIVLLDFIFNF